ncbi:two component transcriptional regulator, AraC family [Lacrimispora sphenoides]|jgi:two-component system response regulator YesN|uniref:response regulator transcription factor n=1 Tax=Lacrimispora sphenoides TaxID=29370 RepID=UPI0008C86E2F|nr:response regulator [Lacrimispora sphenoides]SEU28157.1 two component transcriptional regulator, AraC family [Lacrimispora sphenoides]
MKRVMIVDDEVLVRLGIQSLIKWENYGYQIVCDASDGEEALQKIRQYQPDIVLTDLKMSPVDGFELISECREKYPYIQFVVLSSYNDFDNVRNAMKMGAFDYVFKLTVKPEELLKIMDEATSSGKGTDTVQETSALAERNLEVIKRGLFKRILNSETFLKKYLEELMRLPLSVNFDHPFHILSITIDDFKVVRKKGDFMDLELLIFTMENILSELFNRHHRAEVFQYGEYDFAVAVNLEENQDHKTFFTAMEKEFGIFSSCARQYYGLEVSGALSRECTGIKALKEAIAQNRGTLNMRFFSEPGKLHPYERSVKEEAVLPAEFHSSVLERLAAEHDFFGMRKFLEDLFEFLKEKNRWEPEEIRYLLRKAYGTLAASFARSRADIDLFLDKNGINMEASINDYTYLEKIRQSVLELLEQYKKEYESNSGRILRKEVAEAKSFVRSHMKEELQVAEIAAMVNMSGSYFSHVFKKEEGISFLEYVYRVRMEHARYLLESSDLKVNEIADEVGIFNPNYFSTQFKKSVGQSPLEYRQAWLKKAEDNSRI